MTTEASGNVPAAPEMESPPLWVHGAVLLAAAGLFARIAHGVHTKEIQPLDQATRAVAQGHRSDALDVAVKPVTVLSIPLLVASATAALALWFHREKRPAAALATAITPLVAAAAGQSFTTFLTQRNPPDVGDSPTGEVTEPSFPSGHTTGVTAEACAVGYILAREGLLTMPLGTALAAWPTLVSVTRVYRDRHWASDVLGGLAAGTAVAAGMTLLYEARRKEQKPDKSSIEGACGSGFRLPIHGHG